MLSKFLGGLFLFIILSLSYIIARSVVFFNKNHEKDNQEFWSRESKANSIRRQDISNLDYIHFSVNNLPCSSLAETGNDELQAALTEFENKSILNLSNYTNTDLKMLYGPANLDTLSTCDNNYTDLIKLLNKCGLTLIDTGREADAKAFLEYAVSIGSDISSTYEALGRLYFNANDKKSFAELDKAAHKLSSLSKDLIISKLNNIKTT